MSKHISFTPFFFAILISISLFSCRGEVLETISESEAAEVIQSAISAETEGLVMQVEDVTEIAQTYLDSCGKVYDNQVNKNQNFGVRSYDYTFSWNWQMTCNSLGVPQTLSIGYDADGQYDTPRMTSDDESDGTFIISGLELSAPDYVFNGTVTRSGSQSSKIGNQSSFSSQLAITTTNLTYNKSDDEIASGTADVTISGTDQNGNSFSYTGQVVFNGNNTATLTINGTSYPIQW